MRIRLGRGSAAWRRIGRRSRSESVGLIGRHFSKALEIRDSGMEGTVLT
jgi:hypothetical protein